MKIAVTGSNGLVGSRLVRRLLKNGHAVLGLGRGANRVATKGLEYQSVELTQQSGVNEVLEKFQPEAVINCASATDVDGCERDRVGAYAANVEVVAHLCKAALKHGTHLVHVSTDYVFDGEAGPYSTEAIPNPRGTYAITKHLGEQTLKALLPTSQWTIARTAVVFGWPNAGKNNFGSWLVDSFQQKKPVKLFEDQWVNASLALNVADMLAELAEKKLPGIWHTCGQDVVDRVTFGKQLCARFGFDASLISPSRMADVKLLSPRPAKSSLLVTKTLENLAAKPLSLSQALDRFFTEFKESTS